MLPWHTKVHIYLSLTYDSSYDYVTNPGLRTMKVYPFVVYIYIYILYKSQEGVELYGSFGNCTSPQPCM